MGWITSPNILKNLGDFQLFQKWGCFFLCSHPTSCILSKHHRKKKKTHYAIQRCSYSSRLWDRKMTVRDTQQCNVSCSTLIPWSLRWIAFFLDVILALLTNSWLYSWLPLTDLCQYLLCQFQVHLHLKWTKVRVENTCLEAQFGMFNCAALHTGHAPPICFLSNLLLCQKVFTWKSAVHENIQISLLQGIYRLCLA